MRLICPSCGAQYEVDDSVIPEAGRDVQCSNCGHAWLQMPASQLKAQANREAAAPEASADRSETWTEEDAESPGEVAETAPEEAARSQAPELRQAKAEARRPEPKPEPASKTGTAAVPEPERHPVPKRKTLDDAVVNVLREEADRERRARMAEGSLVETQPELGIAAVTAVAAAVPEQPEDLDAAPVFGEESDDPIASRASRRELLPDIEEINSTLRATSDRGGEPASIDAP